jgi:predicted MFS family arabinose efflux permease
VVSDLARERRIVALVGAVQFINVLDFIMVMPFGPDFGRALGIKPSDLGMVGGSYTAAAAVAGLFGASALGRFDRRKALAWTMAGLIVATALGGFATDSATLFASRVLAGAFGGPATAVAFSVVTDTVPVERRGRAMGAVMGAFSVASVVGVPAGLELARVGGWRVPFFALAALGIPVVASAFFVLPPLRDHLDRRSIPDVDAEWSDKAGSTAMESRAPSTGGLSSTFGMVRRSAVAFALSGTSLTMMSSFLVIPNISAYLEFNAHYPREDLGLLYMLGGAVSFGAMRAAGITVDRVGAPWTTTVGTLGFIVTIVLGFGFGVPLVPPWAIFVAFMASQSVRNVASTSLFSRVPPP